MVIAIIGESCTGKSTLVESLKGYIEFEEYTGKDYLKLAKSEAIAKKTFRNILNQTKGTIIYVISEQDDLDLLPDNTVKVLLKEDLEIIKERFKERMHGNLPKPVEMMIERKHGMFNEETMDLVLESSSIEERVSEVINYIDRQNKLS